MHFVESDFEKEAAAYDEKSGKLITAPLKIIRLKSQAVPSVFDFPSGNTSREPVARKCPDDKKMEREMQELEKSILASQETYKEYHETRKVNSLTDIKKCIDQFGISKFWAFHNNNSNSLFFFHIIFDPEPFIKYAIRIDNNLNLTFSIERNPVSKFQKFSFPIKIKHFNDLINILDVIETKFEHNDSHDQQKSVIDLICNLIEIVKTESNENNLIFIQHQLKILLLPRNHFRYTTELLIFASILKTISSHAYNFIRQSGNIILPHPDTLRKICNNLQLSPQLELQDENFLMYISKRVNFLTDYEKPVILMIDEIHLKAYFDYIGGSVLGAAFNTNKAATSAFVFMIASLLSPFKEVVHILPVKCINFEILHNVIKKVIIGLENISFKVTSAVTDNNSINPKAMSLFMTPPQRSFVYPHPADKNRPLFFFIDSVHIFKNIRNNWLNQKNTGKCFFYPDFDDPQNSQFRTASFMAIRKIYDIENGSDELVSYSRGLTLKSVSPSNLERQSVNLVMKIFNKFVVQALLELGPKYNVPHFKDTAKFIDIICKWWDIFNVKSVNKGIHQRNVYMEPLNDNDCDEKNIFLNKFLIWLDAWQAMNCDTGALSKETHTALVQTTHGMLEFTRYCIDELQMKYVLTGKIQTDSLEARFGKYRQMAGSQYHISIRQLLECEKKLRLQSCVKLELLLNSNVIPLKHFDEEDFENFSSIKHNNDLKNLKISVDDNKIDKIKPLLPVLTYLGGYCSYSLIKKLKCDQCKDILVLDSDINLDKNYNLIKNLDHGGLKCPTQIVVTYLIFNYIIVNSLYSDSEHFMKINNQREAVVKLTYDELKDREIVLDYECPNGHGSDYVCKLILHVSTNIMLKNLCNKENDNLEKMKKDKKNCKRKLQTLKQ